MIAPQPTELTNTQKLICLLESLNKSKIEQIESMAARAAEMNARAVEMDKQMVASFTREIAAHAELANTQKWQRILLMWLLMTYVGLAVWVSA